MKKKLLPVLIVSLLSLGSMAAHAQSTAINTIKAQLTKSLGGRITSISDIKETPIKGLYQVVLNGSQIIYTNPTGNYLLQGDLIDLTNQRNLTAELSDKITRVDFSTLPIQDSMVMVRGNGKRKLALFEDPNCSYCKHLDASLQTLNNVTIYTFLYPILGEKSVNASKNIWCSKDKSKVWTDWMVNGKALPLGTAACDTSAIDRNIEWGRAHSIQATPTLFFENGVKKAGAIPMEMIEKYLNDAKS